MAERDRVGVGQGHEVTLASLFDSEVAVAYLDVVASPPELPLPLEPWLAPASLTRQREFYGGRACARRALIGLGLRPVPIGRGAAGEPIWPPDVVGSITHADGLCAAVAARSAQVHALGVDVEPDRVETAAFVRRICNQTELKAMHGLGAPIEALAPVIFSAKEASYKLQFPLTQDLGAWGNIEVLLSTETFRVRFLGSGALFDGHVHGRWRRAHGFIWTGVALRRS